MAPRESLPRTPHQGDGPVQRAWVDLNEDEAQSSQASPSSGIVPVIPHAPVPGDEEQKLFQSVRIKLSTRDQEAMRKARWTMIEGPHDPAARNGQPSGSYIAPDFGTIPRRSSLAKQQNAINEMTVDGFLQPNRRPSNSSARPDYVIAVIGHDNVGKSTVVRRAIKTWGGSSPSRTLTYNGNNITSSFAQIKAGGKIPTDCKVEFVEVGIAALDLAGPSVWPTGMSPPSGAILCYDASRQATLRGLSETLHHLSPVMPMVLFACKSDPHKTLEVDAHVGDQIGHPYNVGLIEVTTATTQGKHKMRTGLRWLLYRLEERHRQGPQKWQGHRGGQGDEDPHSSSSSLGWIMDTEGGTSTEGSLENSPITVPTHTLLDATGVAMAKAPSTADSENYIGLQELMNRLFTAIVSTENDQFVQTFFMVYRRFCQPRDVMTEFIERFMEVEQYAVSRDIRLWALMKLSGALLSWTSTYPGDLVDDETQALFRKTLSCMLKYTFLAHLTVDLVRVEQSLSSVVDPDRSWSCRPPRSVASTEETAVGEDTKEKQVLASEDASSADHTPISKEKAPSAHSMSTASFSVDAESLLRNKANTDSSSDLSRSMYSNDEGGHRKWSSAIQALLHMDTHTFALELTRLQWEMFAAIRPRDVLRHDFGKERDEPVGRSIDFFNHLSRWVSTIILAHPKPKGRAKIYETFVKIAHQLRRLNNYDSLCAVISGLRETSIHRLSQTHALVRLEPSLHRDLQSHLKLMDARGGYMHYRRALGADATYGHAAIPLLTTVLGLVNRLQAARPEDRRPDGSVQWGKFARFGEILGVIPDFQARGPMVPGTVSVNFRRLIEATPVIGNEDGLYERSKIVEPGGAKEGGMMRKLARLAL